MLSLVGRLWEVVSYESVDHNGSFFCPHENLVTAKTQAPMLTQCLVIVLFKSQFRDFGPSFSLHSLSSGGLSSYGS